MSGIEKTEGLYTYTATSKEINQNSQIKKTDEKDVPVWNQKVPHDVKENLNVDGYVTKRDATYVDNKYEKMQKALETKKEKVEAVQKSLPPRDGKTNYIEDFKDYQPTNQAKYDKVYDLVNKKVDPEKAKSISNMVCALSDDYGIDPEITAAILDHETGGFVFNDKTMKNPGKQYKGVMQVDKTTIEIMYADGGAWKKLKSGTRKAVLSYDHRHFSSDDERIDELKKKYPTPDALYQAIQKDVTLGVEVGIMAYKGKLSRTKGNTRAALAQYCGNQYSLPADSTAVRKIWPLPKYGDT